MTRQQMAEFVIRLGKFWPRSTGLCTAVLSCTARGKNSCIFGVRSNRENKALVVTSGKGLAMFRSGLIVGLMVWCRSYLIALVLIGVLALSFWEVLINGTGPMPQHPPVGHIVLRNSNQLQWSMGTRKEPIRLLISIDDPDFKKPLMDRTVKREMISLPNLEPGRTYYWKLVQGDSDSPTSKFHVSSTALRF